MIIDPSNALAAPGSSRGYARLSVADGSIAASATPPSRLGPGASPRVARGSVSESLAGRASAASGAAGVRGPPGLRPPKSRPRRRPAPSAGRPRSPPRRRSEGKFARSVCVRRSRPGTPRARSPLGRRRLPSVGGGRRSCGAATGPVFPSRLRRPTGAAGWSGRGVPAPRGCLRFNRRCPRRERRHVPPADRSPRADVSPRALAGGSAPRAGLEAPRGVGPAIRPGDRRTACVLPPLRAPSSPLGPRPQIGRGDPLNLSILVSGGKETNQDSLSNGE